MRLDEPEKYREGGCITEMEVMAMMMNGNKEGERLEEALELLQLTPKNLELAEAYLDLSVQENEELLKGAEHQDFSGMSTNAQQSVYGCIGFLKRNNEELAARFIRFLMAAGGTTVRKLLVYYGWMSDFDYLSNILPVMESAALYADYIAWSVGKQNAASYEPLLKLGKENPEIFCQMSELCYHEDSCNTKMLLSALYLHCVKPLEESRSILYIPVADGGKSETGNAGDGNGRDDRAEGTPERIREIRDYLEARLIGNSAGLFQQADEPKGEEEEKLKDFLRNSDPRDEFPYDIRALITGRKKNEYRMMFLPGLAFLAVEHSNRFVSMIRLAAAVEGDAIPNAPLDMCQRSGDVWFHRHIEALEKVLWVPEEAYIRWGILRKEKSVLERMAAKAPDTICEVIKKVPAEDYGYLLAQVKTGNPKLYAEAGEALVEDYRRIAAEQEVKGYEPAGDRAMDYLLGIAEIQDILPYVEQWRELYLYDRQKYARIHNYLEYKEEQLYRRALVLECLRLQDHYFRQYWSRKELEKEGEVDAGKDLNRLQIEGILKLFDDEQVPAQYQIDYFGKVYDSSEYAARGEDSPSQICVIALKEQRGDWHQEWEIASESKYLPARIMAFRVMGERWEEYKSRLLACAAESTKQGREFLRAIYTRRREWEEDILGMLKSPKGGMREMAAEVLKNWGVEQYREQLTQAMEAEKTKKIKTLLQEILAPEQQGAGNGENGQADGMGQPDGEGNTNGMGGSAVSRSTDAIIKDALMGGRKRKLAWLSLENIGKVHKRNGEEASEDHVAAILVSYADMGILGVSREAAQLAEELVPGELAAYVKEVYNRWIEDGAQAKKKWVLYAASIHGGEPIVPILYASIQDWPKHSRGAMAAEAVKALALNGTSTALLLVDQVARKFKFRQVKGAAAEALDYAAAQLGISREELEDRIVPNLGFDERMERIFDYGKRQFKVVLASDLSLEVYDGNGKALKSIPAPGKNDDQELAKESNEAWKLLKKQLKTVVGNQKIRLEQAMRIQRRWEKEKWCELFVKNPVMHQFATGLVWGVYAEEALKDTFRYMEDGTFNTAEEEEYELPENAVIGLVHPIELSEEALAAWKEQMSDYEIVQPIEQLERPVYRVTEEEKEATELIRFGGVAVNGLSLFGKLQDMGWYRGEILDGGYYDTIYRYDQDKGVELVFSGCGVGCENETVVVYEVYFYRPGAAEKVGWRVQPVKHKLGQVDERYFSEVVLQLTKATASSEKRLPYPDCKKR